MAWKSFQVTYYRISSIGNNNTEMWICTIGYWRALWNIDWKSSYKSARKYIKTCEIEIIPGIRKTEQSKTSSAT